MTGRTTTTVHSPRELKAQRWEALAEDRCALSALSVYAQSFIGLALYLYSHVSTPGWLSILGTIPFALILLYLASKTTKNAGETNDVLSFAAGKRGTKLVLFLFLLLHLFNAQLVFAALCAVLRNAMPDHSLWKLALLMMPALSWANSGRQGDALARLTRLMKWIIGVLFLYAFLSAVPHGSAAHFFPVLGYGWKTIIKGVLWMCGAVSGCVWPLLMPQDQQALSPLLARKSKSIIPVLLAIFAGAVTMAVSVWLMPVYALARPETLGWRLMLAAHMTPSIPAWSMEAVGILLLFFMALSHSAGQASALAARMAGRSAASGWTTLLLLLVLTPCAVMQDEVIQEALTCLAFLRGPITLTLVTCLWIGSAVRKKKQGREET